MELVIQDSNSRKIYDVSEIAEKVNFQSNMRDGASKLTFSYLREKSRIFNNGSVVRFKYNGTNIFYGRIFKVDTSEDNKVSVTCYDQLKYLKNKDSMILNGFTVSKIVKSSCDRMQLKVGKIEDSKYVIADTIIDNKTYLDVIYEAIDDTLLATSRKYILLDNFGTIEFRDAKELRIPILIGDRSLAYGYSYSKSIDGESYNQIKLARDNKSSGTRENFIVKDGENIAKWGILQYYEKVNENQNDAQIKQKANDLLKLYNREEESLSLSAIGDTRVRGGTGILVRLEELNIDQWFMVNSVTHEFSKDIHTMDLELVI